MLHRSRFLVSIVVLVFAIQNANAQVDTVLNRYRQYLINSIVPEGDAGKMAAALTANHQWPDLNYADTSRAFWHNLNHMKRLRDLALAYANPNSRYYNRDDIKQAIHNASEHWLAHRYKNANWWHNEIGVPQYMRDMIVLFQKELTPAEREGALQVLAQYKLQESGAGANLTWTADLAFHYGALTGDEQLMKKTSQLIIDEVHASIGEGIQPDFSYHQHGARLQEYHYGAAFLKSNIRIAWQLRGTKWSFPQDKIELLMNFILNGWQWMSRGIYTVPGTIDRAVSRRNYLAYADLRDMLPYLAQLYPEKAAAFQAMLLLQNGQGEPLQGFRYYPYSDFSVYQQNKFGFFLKTISSRTLTSESINSENLKGNLLNSGDGYMMKNGREYYNLMPAWNWDALPGTTSFNGAKTIIRKDFVGSVSDSVSGASSMDYGLQSKDGKRISVKKSWFCHDGFIVCLIALSDSNQQVENIYTALDQCRWQSDVLTSNVKTPLEAGHYSLKNIRWLYHNGLAYLLIDPMNVDLDIKEVTGTWKSINTSETDSLVKEKIFLPLIMHEGKRKLGYVLMTAQTVDEVKILAQKPKWKVLHNEKDYQAASFDDGTIMIAFYAATTAQFGKHQLTVDHPCLVMVKGKKLYLSNPLQTKIMLKGKFDTSTFTASLPDNGYTVCVRL